MASPDDIHLRGWIEARNPDDFEKLVRQHAGLVFATCNRILRNSADAEDATQDCFLKLAQTPPQPGATLAAWLHRVATRRSLDLLKARRRRSIRERIWHSNQSHHTETHWDDYHAAVDQAVDALPDDFRSAIIAHYFEGQTHEAIANAEGISRSAVTQRIQKAVGIVRESLARKDIQVSGAALAAAIGQFAADAAPTQLTVQLIKIGIAPDAAAPAFSAGFASKIAGQKVWFAVAALLVIGGIGAWRATTEFSALRSDETDAAADVSTPGSESDESSARSGEAESATAQVNQRPSANGVDRPRTAQALWQRVLEVNRPWLDPEPFYLHYVKFTRSGSASGRQEVWQYGDAGRVGTQHEAEVLYNGDSVVYLKPLQSLELSPLEKPGFARGKRQGFYASTGIHALVDRGLPQDARVEFDVPELGMATIEAHKLDGDGRWSWSGSNTHFDVDTLHLVVNTETHTPVSETVTGYYQDKPYFNRFVYGPDFQAFKNGLVPSAITWEREHKDFDTRKVIPYRTEAHFQILNGAWIIDRVQRTIGTETEPSLRYSFTDLSTEPFDRALIAYPSDEKLAALKDEWRPGGVLQARHKFDGPMVVGVYPEHATGDLTENQTIRIAFDRPMNPNQIDLRFEKGGFMELIGPIDYFPDTYEFAISVRLAKGERHRAIINADVKEARNDGGFRSPDGISAIPYRWSFETAADAAVEDAAQPVATLLTPGVETITEFIQPVEIGFDLPMNPERYSIEAKDSDSDWRVYGVLEEASYNPETQRFRFLLQFDADTKCTVKLDGFVSADGIAADPVTLQVDTPAWDDNYELPESEMESEDDRRLIGILASVAEARQSLYAATVEVTQLQLGHRSVTRVYDQLETKRAAFAFEGEDRFVGDVSGIMSGRFIVGSDGDTCWIASGPYGDRPPSRTVLPFEDVPDRYLSFCDPFRLSEFDPKTAVEELGLQFKGTELLHGRRCFVIESRNAKNRGYRLSIRNQRWHIDASTFRLLQYASPSGYGIWYSTYEYTSVNEPIPAARFRPPDIPNQIEQAPMPLEPELNRRFLTVRDGQDGHMSVRWGINNEQGGRKSGGLN